MENELDIDKMSGLRIITVLLIAAVAWAIAAGPALAWSRYGHYRYDSYQSRFHPWHHGFPEYIHDCRPRYKSIYTEKEAWDLVKRDQSRTALEIFEDISVAAPATGNPKLGIAIAAADTGDLSKSVTAMRMALRYNPGALQLFEPEDWLKDRLQKLVKKYQGRSRGLQYKDACFMTAAFYYMLKDKNACLEAVRLGKKAKDTRDSALNLFYMAENDEWRFH